MRRAAHTAAVLECGVAEPIIGRAFVGVFQDLVGLVDLLETMLGVLVPGIDDPDGTASPACERRP